MLFSSLLGNDMMNSQPADNNVLIEANELLKRKLFDFTDDSGRFNTDIEGLTITRFNQPHKDDNCFYVPSIGLIVQGDKESVIGETTLNYGAYHCVVNSVDVPSESRVFNVSPDSPFLAISLMIDPKLVCKLNTTHPSTSLQTSNGGQLGVSITKTSKDIVEAFTRLIDLLSTPECIPVLAPLYIQEIHYYILTGSHATALRNMATKGLHSNQIAQAITWLRENYAQTIGIDWLAQQVDMALTSFHRHFKQVTSMSPLQFQKSLRLHEAQRIMLTEGKDANTTSFIVGYDSPTQFNRDYKKMFGEPPLKNIQRLRLLHP